MLQSSAKAPSIWWEKEAPQEMLAKVHSSLFNEMLSDQWWRDTAPPGHSGWLTSTGTDRLEEFLVTNITWANIRITPCDILKSHQIII